MSAITDALNRCHPDRLRGTQSLSKGSNEEWREPDAIPSPCCLREFQPAFFILNVMSKVRVSSFSVSLDGYAAGPRQSLENPLGERGPELFQWFFPTRTFKQMQGQEGGSTGTDNEWAQRGMENVGAWILGRNMFGPVRGPWPDDSWKGWWGDEPPYHVPVFVLTHHPRKPLEMKGGTTFHFVTDGIHAALERAREAAGRDKKTCVSAAVRPPSGNIFAPV